MPNQKCDSCGKFGEVEEVIVTIKKHKDCDINSAFGNASVSPKIAPEQPKLIDLTLPNPTAPYVSAELEKMIIK